MKTPTSKNGPENGRFLTIRVRIPAEDYERGLPYFGSRRRLSGFAVEAVNEKINRAMAHDKEARQRELMANTALLESTMRKLFEEGKLDYLKDLFNARD